MNMKAFDKMADRLKSEILENQTKAKNAKDFSLQLYYEGRQHAQESALILLQIAVSDFRFGTYEESEDAG